MGQLSVHPIIYQLCITLRGISPLIWRFILVRSETTLAQLRAMLQILFAWSDEGNTTINRGHAATVPPHLTVVREVAA